MTKSDSLGYSSKIKKTQLQATNCENNNHIIKYDCCFELENQKIIRTLPGDFFHTFKWVKIFKVYDDFKSCKINSFEFKQISFSIRQNYWNNESLKWMLRKRKIYNLNMNIQSKTGKVSKKVRV
ncbi:hypothetical protein AAW50_02445 [Mycoplasmopsis canis]|nr:hypothetical protein AAW50_02445 [Mycoplasmopsis canis]